MSTNHVHLSQLLTDYHSKSEDEPTEKDRDSMIAVIRQFVIEKEKDHSHEMEDVQVVEDLTDHLMRFMAIPSVRSNLSDLLQIIIATRIVVRNTHAKNVFAAFDLISKLMDQYQTPTFHLECWKLIYNVCMDEDQKDVFIRTGGLIAMKKTLVFIDNSKLMSEICEFISLISIGKNVRYRICSLFEYGVIYCILSILTHFRDDADIVEKAFVSLRYLFFYSNEEIAVKNGVQELVCELLLRHNNPALRTLRKKGIVVLQNLFSLDTSHETSVPIVPIVMELFRQATQKDEIDQLILLIGNLSCLHNRSVFDTDVFSINYFIPSSIASQFVSKPKDHWAPISDEQIDKMYQRFMTLVDTAKPSPFYDFQNYETEPEPVFTNPHKTTRRSVLYFNGENGLARCPRGILSLPPLEIPPLETLGSFAPDGDTENDVIKEEEEVAVDVPDVSECKTIAEILMKVLETADEKRAVLIFYVIRLVAKTQAVAEDLVRRGILSMLVKPTFSRNKRVARNACAALYALAANSSEASLMPVEEMKGFTINDEMLLDFISKLGGASPETAIRVLILCGFSFSKSVFTQFPSLSSFYQEIQEKMTKKNTEFMAQISASPVDVLGVVAEYLNFSNPLDQ